MEVMYANLHMHSTFSDAGLTPRQLVRIGKALGHKALALTDHETDGGCDAFAEACREEDMECITGAEFYGQYNGRKMHITALDFDRSAPSLRSFIDQRCQLQARWTRAGFQKAQSLGLLEDVSWEEVVTFAGPGAWLCYDSVLNVLEYKHLLTAPRRAAIVEVFLRDPETVLLKPEYPQAQQVIRAVRDAGGVVGVAHASATQFDYLEQLVDLGMNGIEVCYPAMTEQTQALTWELAQRRRLYRMGGTDHTGPMSGNGGKYAVAAFHGISEEDYRILTERRFW